MAQVTWDGTVQLAQKMVKSKIGSTGSNSSENGPRDKMRMERFNLLRKRSKQNTFVITENFITSWVIIDFPRNRLHAEWVKAKRRKIEYHFNFCRVSLLLVSNHYAVGTRELTYSMFLDFFSPVLIPQSTLSLFLRIPFFITKFSKYYIFSSRQLIGRVFDSNSSMSERSTSQFHL